MTAKQHFGSDAVAIVTILKTTCFHIGPPLTGWMLLLGNFHDSSVQMSRQHVNNKPSEWCRPHVILIPRGKFPTVVKYCTFYSTRTQWQVWSQPETVQYKEDRTCILKKHNKLGILALTGHYTHHTHLYIKLKYKISYTTTLRSIQIYTYYSNMASFTSIVGILTV